MHNSTEISAIVGRKLSHFELCAHQEVEFRNKTTLLEDVELVHQPLTETALEEIKSDIARLKQANGINA